MLKRYYPFCLILFWALWWSSAFLTDFLGGLHSFGIIHYEGLNAISNYAFLKKTLSLYHAPIGLVNFFYIGIIGWLALCSGLFWRALYQVSIQSKKAESAINCAFFISLLLWLSFFLADNSVLQFQLEENHMVQGGFELLSWLSLYILPEAINSK